MITQNVDCYYILLSALASLLQPYTVKQSHNFHKQELVSIKYLYNGQRTTITVAPINRTQVVFTFIGFFLCPFRSSAKGHHFNSFALCPSC